MTVGSIIHSLRLEKNLPQKAIAEYLNVSVATVSNYEVDRHLPDVNTLAKLADFYDVSVDYLIGRTKSRRCMPE